MIIDATYITESDMGKFYSEAKFDCFSGEVLDIEQVDDEEAENIEQIFGTKISVQYLDKKFIIDVDPHNNVAIDYKNTRLYKLVMIKELSDNLHKSLPKNTVNRNNVKI